MAEGLVKPKRVFSGVEVINHYILVVGTSGSGKSAIINNLKSYGDVEETKSKSSAQSVTMESISQTSSKRFLHKDKEYILTFYDTRGLTDSSRTFEQMIEDWNKAVRDYLVDLHYVLFVTPIDRVSLAALGEVNKMFKRLEEWGCRPDNVITLLNKTDFYEDSIIASYIDGFKKLPLHKHIQTSEVFPVCFPKLDEIKPAYKEYFEDRLTECTNQIMERILVKVTSFKPRQMIMMKEEKERIRLAREEEERIKSSTCLIN